MIPIHFVIPINFWRAKERNYLMEFPVIFPLCKIHDTAVYQKKNHFLYYVIYTCSVFQDSGACSILAKYQEMILQQLFSSVTPSKLIFTLVYLKSG